MIDERKLDEEVRRGHEAERLLAHPLLVEAFDTLENHMVAQLRAIPLTDAALERESVRTLQVLHKVKHHIQQIVLTGRMAAEQRESLPKRVLRAVRG